MVLRPLDRLWCTAVENGDRVMAGGGGGAEEWCGKPGAAALLPEPPDNC